MSERTQLIVVLTAVAASLVGCSSISVNSDFDRTADFDGYSSYAWIEWDETDRPAPLPDHLDRRLRRVTEDVLDGKGMERAPSRPQADILLTYYVGIESELRVSHVPHAYARPYGYGYWPTYGHGYTDVRRYHTGTLVLDVVDNRTHQLVWTGAVESAVQSANPPSDRIRVVIEKLLRGFPPRSQESR